MQDHEEIKEMDKFVYLDSVVSKDGGTDEDIKSRINKARHAFNTLRQIWRSKALSVRNKIRIFNTNVKSVLLYSSKTWRVTNTTINKLQTFTNRCLRNILNIRWPEAVSNEELWNKTSHTGDGNKEAEMGMNSLYATQACSNITRQALDRNPQRKRKVDRPKQIWRRSIEAETKVIGIKRPS